MAEQQIDFSFKEGPVRRSVEEAHEQKLATGGSKDTKDLVVTENLKAISIGDYVRIKMPKKPDWHGYKCRVIKVKGVLHPKFVVNALDGPQANHEREFQEHHVEPWVEEGPASSNAAPSAVATLAEKDVTPAPKGNGPDEAGSPDEAQKAANAEELVS